MRQHKCNNCGSIFLAEKEGVYLCPKCAKEAVQEKIKARKRKYMESYNRDVRPVIRAERKENGTVCVVCGKTFTTTTPTVTCSPECAKEQKRRLQAIYDYKRGEGNVESFIKPKTEKK